MNYKPITVPDFIENNGHMLDLEISLYEDNSVRMTLFDQTRGVNGWDPSEITRNYREKKYIDYDDDEIILVYINLPAEQMCRRFKELGIAVAEGETFFNNIYACPILKVSPSFVPKKTLLGRVLSIFGK